MKENVINSFIDTIWKYFDTHKEAKTYEIGKGALAYLCGIGMTSVEALCAGMSLETVSIHDLRGKIIVDRQGFLEWLELRYQAKKAKQKADSDIFYANQEAFGPEREMRLQMRRKEEALKRLEEYKKEIPKVAAEADELEREVNNLRAKEELRAMEAEDEAAFMEAEPAEVFDKVDENGRRYRVVEEPDEEKGMYFYEDGYVYNKNNRMLYQVIADGS